VSKPEITDETDCPFAVVYLGIGIDLVGKPTTEAAYLPPESTIGYFRIGGIGKTLWWRLDGLQDVVKKKSPQEGAVSVGNRLIPWD